MFQLGKTIVSEDIIKKMTNIPVIGRIEEEPYFDKNVVKEYADLFRKTLENL